MSRGKWAGGLSVDGRPHRTVHVLLVQVDVARDELVLGVRERRLQLKRGGAYGARCDE